MSSIVLVKTFIYSTGYNRVTGNNCGAGLDWYGVQQTGTKFDRLGGRLSAVKHCQLG